MAFTNGLRFRIFLFFIYKNDLKTMDDMLNRAMKFMNAENVVTARGGGLKK